MEDTKEYRGQIVHEIRRFQPDVILAMDPYRLQVHSHRDHRISGQVALDACYPFARDGLHYPEHLSEGLETYKVGDVLLWGTENPDIAVDIAGTIDVKLNALAAHESQLSSDMERISGFVKRRARDAAERASTHTHTYEYCEVFRHISFRR